MRARAYFHEVDFRGNNFQQRHYFDRKFSIFDIEKNTFSRNWTTSQSSEIIVPLPLSPVNNNAFLRVIVPGELGLSDIAFNFERSLRNFSPGSDFHLEIFTREYCRVSTTNSVIQRSLESGLTGVTLLKS